MARTGFSKLTKDAVKRLAPGAKLNERGITVECLRTGELRWSINVMVSGRRIHRVIGQGDGVTRSDCEAYIERVRTEEREGRLTLPAGRKTWLTFEQVARRYLDRMDRGGGKNLDSKRHHLNVRLIPYFKAQRADTLTEFTIKTYQRKRLEQAAAPGTVNREMATLKHMLRDAVKNRDLKAVPCPVPMLQEPKGRTVTLSDDEADKLMQAAIADQNPDVWLFVAFGLNTAMRHSEILAARYDEIDWARGRLHIPKAKAGAREQPLTPGLVATLRKERSQRPEAERDGFIFPARRVISRDVGHIVQMAGPFKRVVERAGLDPQRVTPHVMRHTANTKLVEAGVDLPTIQRISGHKTLAMVLRYSHVSGRHIDNAMKALDRTLPEPASADENVTGTQVTQELHTARQQRVAGGRAASRQTRA